MYTTTSTFYKPIWMRIFFLISTKIWDFNPRMLLISFRYSLLNKKIRTFRNQRQLPKRKYFILYTFTYILRWKNLFSIFLVNPHNKTIVTTLRFSQFLHSNIHGIYVVKKWIAEKNSFTFQWQKLLKKVSPPHNSNYTYKQTNFPFFYQSFKIHT